MTGGRLAGAGWKTLMNKAMQFTDWDQGRTGGREK
jgi:hypothetical protein